MFWRACKPADPRHPRTAEGKRDTLATIGPLLASNNFYVVKPKVAHKSSFAAANKSRRRTVTKVAWGACLDCRVHTHS
jgi:hypothetical protein